MSKADILAERIDALIRAHHDAFLVELLGGQVLAAERIRELIDEGYITTADLSGFEVPDLENAIDYYTYVHLVSRIFDDTSPEKRHELRRWDMDQWGQAIDAKYTEVWQAPPPEERTTVTFEAPQPDDLEIVEFPIDAPDWLSRSEGRAYEAAVERAGAYVTRLRDSAIDELEQIREATAQAVAEGDEPRELAVELMRRTDDWEHNWERIARTEIQGAYNEGRIMSALEAYGQEARIAKVTETGACRHCLRLHRDADGRPQVFTVRELLDNGTNVGKPRASWQATIWPVHPNCRCDTVVVPPGLIVGEYGQLEEP